MISCVHARVRVCVSVCVCGGKIWMTSLVLNRDEQALSLQNGLHPLSCQPSLQNTLHTSMGHLPILISGR